jgi:hypothetical protein
VHPPLPHRKVKVKMGEVRTIRRKLPSAQARAIA